MEKQVKTKVWEQQPKESDQAYAAFSLYRDMGKKRTGRPPRGGRG